MQSPQDNRTNELLERIAIALEKKQPNILYNGDLKNIEDIPGFEGTLDKLDDLCNVRTKDVLDTVKTITDDYASKHPVDKLQGSNLPSLTEQEILEDDDVHNDYLNDLVMGMNQIEYLQFHNEMSFSFASNDAQNMSDAIYELEYEECLGAIKKALFIKGDDDYISYAGGDEEAGKNFVINALDGYANLKANDPYTYDNELREYHCGVVNDSDFDIRKTAYSYDAAIDEDLHTKKDCILDYVTNEFGILGARYTDIIKFAYYLGAPNNPKYTSANRGYYSIAFSPRMNGHLIKGGKDYLVKGINNEGDERYFAFSFVEQATDYWKYVDDRSAR